MLSAYLSDLSPEIQIEIWRWLVDNCGMPTIIAVIAFAIIVFFFYRIAAMVKCKSQEPPPMPKISGAPAAGTQANQTAQPPSNNSGVNIQNVANSTINVNIPLKQEVSERIVELPKPLRQRDWLSLTTPSDKYERAAGFRAIGDIYHTAEDWPRFYILHASARVYTATEEHFDGEAEQQYILLEQPDMITAPHRVRICDNADEQQKTLRELYELAHKRAEAGKATSVPL